MRTEIIELYEVEFEVEYTTDTGDENIPDTFNIEDIFINNTSVYEVLSKEVIDRLYDELSLRIC